MMPGKKKKKREITEVVNVNQIITISVVFECAVDKNNSSISKKNLNWMSEITTADTKNKQTLGYLHIKVKSGQHI